MEQKNRFPIDMKGQSKTDLRTQFAALCWRKGESGVEILLITSRDTGRWIIPKGWPMDGKTPVEAAETEAWEEAGVTGKMAQMPVGMFSYVKPLDATRTPCLAMVFALKVKTLHHRWPERKQRERKWFSAKRAAKKVTDPELAMVIRGFDPARL